MDYSYWFPACVHWPVSLSTPHAADVFWPCGKSVLAFNPTFFFFFSDQTTHCCTVCCQTVPDLFNHPRIVYDVRCLSIKGFQNWDIWKPLHRWILTGGTKMWWRKKIILQLFSFLLLHLSCLASVFSFFGGGGKFK